ncbi:MAG: chromate transporter [Syntrophobacteraceae bacterium]|nr:chromate transporter [Syntrophobacteraceae bacterium]
MPKERTGSAPPDETGVGLWRLARTFLGIGLSSFSLAALGETQERVTKKRKWFTADEYMQGLALAQLLPGAPTVNLSSYLGFRLRGLAGAAVASVFFLIPCFLLMLLLSHLYFQYGRMSLVSGLFHGLGALVIGLIFNTILNLFRSGVKTSFNCLMALAGFLMVFWFQMGVVWILLIAGGASVAMVLLNIRFPALARWTGDWEGLKKSNAVSAGSAGYNLQRGPDSHNPSSEKICDTLVSESLKSLCPAGSENASAPDTSDFESACCRAPLHTDWRRISLLILSLTLILTVDLALIRLRPEVMRMGGAFLRIGALTFGSGYAMLPFIQNAVVTQFGWLTNQQFAVALALSLITPGPVTIIGVFIGYKVAGITGALAGMVNMYLPAWAITTLVAAPYARAGRAVHVKKVIGSIVAAFIGTLVVVLIKLSANTLVDFPAITLAASAFIVQRFTRLDTVWIVLGGALVSLAVFH